MGLIDNIANRLGFVRKGRRYGAARVNRLTSDWTSSTTSANAEIKGDLKILRARSRQLERDNDYVRRWLKVLENNVLGADGVKLQAKAKDSNGQYDEEANRIIEEAWREWGNPENCTVTGRQSWRDVQRIILRSVARDGSIIVRLVRNYKKSAHRFSLQLIEADLLDHEYNATLKNGSKIVMGVEVDSMERPQAFHLHASHDAERAGSAHKRQRVPAEEIIYCYMPERAHQAVGVPWLTSAMTRLNMLDGYEEAELTAARVSACKMGFYTRNDAGEGYVGDTDEAGNLIAEAEAGQFEELPNGVNFQAFDPTHPSGNYAPFIKAALRGIASGLNISYNTLANDLEGVNYSSIRAGLLEEREEWKTIQSWLIDHVINRVFFEWLEMAMLSGQLSLPAAKIDKFSAVEWRGRRWPWVDPLKDVQASILSVNNGFKSRRRIVAESGGDIEDTMAEIAEDKVLAQGKGLSFPFPQQQQAGRAFEVEED